VTLEAKKATVKCNGEEITVPLSRLKKGDIIIVHPRERALTDGVVVSGESNVDELLATGEPMPIEKARGMRLPEAPDARWDFSRWKPAKSAKRPS
jgi:Cu+-exporting ATPase